MDSLLYVSARTAPPGSGSADIDGIVAEARLRNESLNITGALVATPTHFAQLMEGSNSTLIALMERIARDDRHSSVKMVHLDPKVHREMSRWSLAYCGESTYVSNLIGSSFKVSSSELKMMAEQIRSLMLMFA